MAEDNTMMQFLTFKLDDEVFALHIEKIREVLEFTTVTKMPRTPEFMRGVINLRGSVVPVIDMKQKFGMSYTEKAVDTCVVIVEVGMEGEKVILGAMVDSVKEVMELEQSAIEPPPKIGTQLSNEYIEGMGKQDDEFVIILDIDKVFSTLDLTMVTEMKGQVPSEAELEKSVNHA
ncbi:chemotaxis protein CheW [Candidatus Magnetomonas plexicatena]|uniref:chemotaxis protein CheW n=1 Tax=Candidatus Magnetomonas plexicatena TaxID=2552947 RepID=UPI001C791026|nr:chemotaxis protein CheW [Nitrospirales bacterium LBB_01]